MTMKGGVITTAVLAVLTAGSPSSAQVLSFDERPSVKFGKSVRLDVTARLQGDALERSTEPGTDDGFDLARRRIGLEGEVTRYIEFQVERELGAGETWRDVFVNVRPLRAIQLRAGQFKMPFSLDQLTSATKLDFVYRSRAADMLAPGRSQGFSVHGRLAGRLLGYDVGLFRRDGESARFGTNPGAGQTGAARMTVRPFDERRARPSGPGQAEAKRRRSISDLEFGVNATSGEVPEGRYSLRGRLTSRSTFFAPVFVNGRRLRVGGDVDWRPGPFGVRAEIMRVEDQRLDQGLRGETLPPLRSDGWYVSGTWAVAGRRAMKLAEASRVPVGFKGLELASRIEGLAFGSLAESEPALRNPRAAHLASIDEHAYTFGVNWTLNRWTRLQFNAIREQLHDAANGAPVHAATWTRVVRVQFAM
jgi:phosphate-selective porin OprO and OprP